MEVRKLKRAVLREEYMAITDSNIIESLILNQLIYWSQRIYDFDKFIKEEKLRFEANGKTLDIELQNGWIFKSSDEFRDELMLKETTKTIKRHLTKLEERGFIDKRRNPKIKYDRTYQYRVNLFNIVVALRNQNYTLEDYKVDFDDKDVEALKTLNGQNIQKEDQEITSEGTNFPADGKNVSSSGKFVPSSGKNVATIPKTISEITTENITTTTSSPQEYDYNNSIPNEALNGDVEDKNIKNISSTFFDLTKRYPNSNDLAFIQQVLNHKIDALISITGKESIIKNTLLRIHKDFKTKNPKDSIHSFKYFLNPILDEFKKYENLKKGVKSYEQTKSRKDESNSFVDEYGTSIDFSKFATNR